MQDMKTLTDKDLLARYSACNRAMDADEENDLFYTWLALQNEVDRREEARYREAREQRENNE